MFSATFPNNQAKKRTICQSFMLIYGHSFYSAGIKDIKRLSNKFRILTPKNGHCFETTTLWTGKTRKIGIFVNV